MRRDRECLSHVCARLWQDHSRFASNACDDALDYLGRSNTMLRRKHITAVILLVLALGTLSAKGVLAWWSGWYSPNFTGSYSPTSYQHGQWNSTVSGGTEAFGSEMQWNQSRADGVRAYSNNRNWIWFCGNCFSYYTHDHTDMSGRLNAKAYATNFPNASIDLDDDDSNGRWEEIEATSVNQSFPTLSLIHI